MILAFALCATAAAFVGPSTPQKTTALQHHKVRSQVADLKIYREEIDWETGEVVKREVEEIVDDLVAKQPVKLKYTYEERRGEEGQKLALPPVFGGVGAALVVPGPGFYHAAAGLISANSVHSRVLVMTGAPHYSNSWTAEGATEGEDLSLLAVVLPSDFPSVLQPARTSRTFNALSPGVPVRLAFLPRLHLACPFSPPLQAKHSPDSRGLRRENACTAPLPEVSHR